MNGEQQQDGGRWIPDCSRMSLTDAVCRCSACPAYTARVRFTDSGGPCIEVTPNGSRRWFWKHLFSSTAVARELQATRQIGGSPRYAARRIEHMEKDLFPWIGSLPLQDITAPLLLRT